MSSQDPRAATPATTPGDPKRAPREAGVGGGSEALGGRLKGAAAAGTEIVIAVLVSLAFFAVFMLGMSVLVPSGLTLGQVVQPAVRNGDPDEHNFTASLTGLGNLGDRLNPAAAMLTVLNTQVMRKAVDGIAWGAVPSGTPLREGDAVQTTRDGTALLTFSRGKRLQLERNSLMIVRDTRDVDEAVNPAPSVHVMMGELWGNVVREGDEKVAVRVTSPGAETQLSPGGSGPAQFRIAVGKDQRSVLSVYRGTAEVVAHGRTVRVAANQYVAVDSLRGASAPAALPGSPALLAPDGGATFSYRELAPQVEFRWDAVSGADGYRLLVSRSPEFQGVVIDQRLTTTRFTCGSFSSGPYYWRVSALRAGAEGAPSEPRAVVVSNVQRPPALTVQFPGAIVNADQCTIRGTTDAGIRIVVAGVKAAIDAKGGFEQVVTLKRGFNVVVVEAIDRVGNTAYKSKVIEAKF
jgi:hypothetical protein